MGERYTRYSTANDVMKEFLIYGAELTEMGFPKLRAVNCNPEDSVDFQSSLSRSLKGHKKLNVNFYIEDYKIQCLWNNIGKYINHLSYFESVCGLNYSIDTRMPLVMQMWNKYRNMAVDWYLTLYGIVVVPHVTIMPYKGREWLLDGIPKHSAISCSTIGKVRSKEAVREFCDGFKEMEQIIEPKKVVIIGIIPDELKTNVDILNFKSSHQKDLSKYRR